MQRVSAWRTLSPLSFECEKTPVTAHGHMIVTNRGRHGGRDPGCGRRDDRCVMLARDGVPLGLGGGAARRRVSFWPDPLRNP